MKPSIVTAAGSKMRAVRMFLLSQGVTVAGNLLYGLLCVRLLGTADYAKFVVLFGVQGTLVILMDVGISGSLVPLVGERVADKVLIADYLASVRALSLRLYLAFAAVVAIAYPLLVRNRSWSWQVVSAMVVALWISTWFMRVGAAYGAVLILLRERTYWYRGQMIASLGTLTVLCVCWRAHRLSAASAIAINVGGIVVLAAYYFHHARRLLQHHGAAAKEKQREIVRLSLPNVPGIIFYAMQGQVALLLITFFGHTTAVASIGALSRLGQIFSLFTQMNPLLIEPYFAALPRSKLWSNYLLALAMTGGLCAVIVASAVCRPQMFLWILGPQYSGLRYEVVLVICTSAISYLTNVLWVIHTSRRFIYWWNNVLNIAMTIAVQAVFIWKIDLTSVRSVVLLNLATVVTAFATNIMSGMYGYLRGPRQVCASDVPAVVFADPTPTTVIAASDVSHIAQEVWQ